MEPGLLAQVLRPLKDLFPAAAHPHLLVGLDISDDAAVYQISDDCVIIQTLDFFTPVVDDAYDYGAIAAANAMSDIYAMGGEVTMALNICAFPPKLPAETIGEILRGGAEMVAAAGGALVGGHTIDDEEPKYGLSVMGLGRPDQLMTKAGARPGDLLVLTKPLGVGIITTAAKGDMAAPAHMAAAVESMKELSRTAVSCLREAGVRACTDVTGFALLGHACEMAEKSRTRLTIRLSELPFLPGAKEYADGWLFPAGSCRNEQCYQEQVCFDPGISSEMQCLLYTPETSGGLLAAVPPGSLQTLEAQFRAVNQPYWVIGEVREGSGVYVSL